MNPWVLIAGILLLLTALGFTRIRLSFVYLESGMKLRLQIGFLRFQLYPQTQRAMQRVLKRAQKPKKEPKEEKVKARRQKDGFSLVSGDIADLWGMGGKLGKRFLRLLRVDKLEICLTPGGQDAAQIAARYGYYNAAFAVVIPLLERFLRIKRHRYEVRLDYDRETALCRAVVTVSVSVGGVLRFGFASLFALIGFLFRHRKRAEGAKQVSEQSAKSPGEPKAA